MYCVNPEDDQPIFFIDAQIGKDNENPTDPYIDGNQFARELMAMDGMGKEKIWVWINSPGGLVTEGMAIYGAILKTKTKVNTLCYGIAYSIAGVIFQAGRERVMLDYAKLMYHMAYNADGEKDKGLDVINEAIATMVSSRSWKDEQAVKRMMELTSYISAKDALESDLCDTVEESGKLNKPRTIARWEKAIEYVNKETNNKQKPQMKAIAKQLGLPENATEAQIIEAISKQEALAKKNADDKAKADAEIDKLRKDMEDSDDAEDRAKLKAKIKDLEDKAKAKDVADTAKAKKDEEDIAKAKAKENAKAKILETVNKKGLKLEDKVMDRYLTLAGESEDSLNAVIETIEAIPTVKRAASLEIDTKNSNSKTPLFKTDGSGGVTDTSDMVAYMNSAVRNKSTKRFSGKEE